MSDSDCKALWLAVINVHANAACGEFFKYNNDENEGKVVGPIINQYKHVFEEYKKAGESIKTATADPCEWYYRDRELKQIRKNLGLKYKGIEDKEERGQLIKEAMKDEKNTHKKCGKCQFCVSQKLFRYEKRPISIETKASRYWFTSGQFDGVCEFLEIADHHADNLFNTIQEAITLEKTLFETFKHQAPLREHHARSINKFYTQPMRKAA